MSGRAFDIVVFPVLRPPKPFPGARSAASRGVAHLSIIFVVRIIGVSTVNHFLVSIAEFRFLVRDSDLNA
jgi:hypothetical protein